MEIIRLPDGRELRYELTRKRVKNINFRAKENGIISVSASAKVSKRHIEQCIIERADFFFDAFERLKSRERVSEISTKSIRWLGKELPVRVVLNSREIAVLDEDECRVFTRDEASENVLRLIESAVAQRFKAVCAELNAQVRNELQSRGLKPPAAEITIKDMKSRWGSCSYTRGHISINLRLAAYPRDTVLSVFWHEYAHFWHHDHSDKFYRFLLEMFPEYHKHNNILKTG